MAHRLADRFNALGLPYLPEAASVMPTAGKRAVEAVRIEVAAGIAELDILRRFSHEAPPKTNRPFGGPSAM